MQVRLVLLAHRRKQSSLAYTTSGHIDNFSQQENVKYKYGCKSRNARICSQDLPAKTVLLELWAVHHARDRSTFPARSGWNLFGFRRAAPKCSHMSELLFPRWKSFCEIHSINTRKPLAVSVARVECIS
jgi:hypothetical protein